VDFRPKTRLLIFGIWKFFFLKKNVDNAIFSFLGLCEEYGKVSASLLSTNCARNFSNLTILNKTKNSLRNQFKVITLKLRQTLCNSLINKYWHHQLFWRNFHIPKIDFPIFRHFYRTLPLTNSTLTREGIQVVNRRSRWDIFFHNCHP